jgi:hypothetical protein
MTAHRRDGIGRGIWRDGMQMRIDNLQRRTPFDFGIDRPLGLRA